MRVKDFILMYSGMNRVEVEIYASITVFNEVHYVPVAEFAMDCANFYTKRTENYLSEEVTVVSIPSSVPLSCAYSNTIASSGVFPVLSPIPNSEQLTPLAP